MKTSPSPQSLRQVRVFTALFVSFLLLAMPIAPLAAATVPLRAGGARSLAAAFDPTVIQASKTDSFADPDGDGKAEPGATITYDVNVSNTGAADATGVAFNDTIDPNTTLVPGSLRVSPLAFADSYNTAKDTALSVPAPGVLANDTGTPAPTAQPIAGGATAHGGSVTLNADGSFNYTPPAGFQGADTFTYTATNGLSPNDAATVTINVDDGPFVTTTSPTNGATNVAQTSNITINFSEPVNAAAASFSLQCPSGSPQSFTLLNASPSASFTLDPSADLPAGASCTVTVSASQITDADTFDPPDQMAADYNFSFGVKPLAVDDMRTATGNVRIDTATTGYSVLANDQVPGGSITAYDAASAHGGNVVMNTATGTFAYDPPRGFTGTDSFHYTISNSSGSAQATVVVTVTDMIWFVNNTPGACSSACDGRLSHPFQTLAAFEAVNGNGTVAGGAVVDPEAGDNIFLYSGSGSYTGPVTLENAQRLIVQGASSSLATLAAMTPAPDSDPLPAPGGANPVITTTAAGANGINLAQNNSIHGLSVVNTTGTGLSGTNFGALTVSENVVLSNTTTAGTPVSLTSGTLAAVFKSISAGNAAGSPAPANGIFLKNTTGSITVDGDGANTSRGGNASGGTIQRTAGADNTTNGIGVYLENASGVTLRRMTISSNPNYGVRGKTVSGFALEYSTVNGTNGTSSTADNETFALGEDSVRFTNLTGSDSVESSIIAGGQVNNLRVVNNTGALNRLTVNNSLIGDSDGAGSQRGLGTPAQGGNSDVLIDARHGVSAMNVTLSNNTLNYGSGDVVRLVNNDNAAPLGAMDVVVRNNSMVNTVAAPNHIPGSTILTVAGLGNVTYDISCNKLANPEGIGLNVFKGRNSAGTPAANFTGTIFNNTIGDAGVPASGSGSGASALSVDQQGTGTHTVLIKDNVIRGYDEAGIRLDNVDNLNSLSTLNATVVGNLVAEPDEFAFAGVYINGGADASSDSNNVTNLKLGGGAGERNDFSAGDPNDFNDIFILNSAGQFNLTKGVSGSSDPLQVSIDNNTPPAPTAYADATIVVVNTAPALPPAVSESCSPPVASLNVAPAGGGMFTALFGGPPAYLQVASLGDAVKFAFAGSAPKHRANSAAVAPLVSDDRASARQRVETISAPKASAAPRAMTTALSGETVSASVGTLPAGKSVRISFQVTVNDPLPHGTNQVSNQGSVSGSNFATVLTDDPAAGGTSDPTVTPVLTPPDVSVKDATVNEPASGTNPAAFAVTLSHAFTHPVTVTFSTADDTGGAHPATAGSDYTPTSGTLTFNPGEVVKTVSVPVLADGDTTETNETFLVQISNATGGASVARAQATGTITPESTPGTLIISELRTSGPAGADDEFVELLNNTGADITVQTSDSSNGWAIVKSGNDCSATPVVVAVIPSGTIISARGNYLVVGSAYSLATYAAGDLSLTSGIESDANVALFNTAELSNISTVTRLDAVGFGSNTGGNCDLLREGATLQPAQGSTSEYSFVRKVDKGATADTNDNAADFVAVSTTPATAVGANATPTLGAPGPESLTSPRGPVACKDTGTALFDRARLDSTVSVGSAPNTVRDATSDPGNNSTFGTIDFRRRFTNNTGGMVTRLRFRITGTTDPASPGKADLRARTSAPVVVGGVNDPATCGGSAPCSVSVVGTTLEQPPTQGSGGAVNSSLGVGTVTLATPLAPGASVNLRLLFGVQQHGDYHVSMVVEATSASGQTGQDEWELRGNTQTGGDTDGGCNTPPVANAGADQTIECGGATTSVLLDGSASTDADNDPLTYEWREGATVLGTTAVLNTSLPFGAHNLTLKVTDPSGEFSTDTVNVHIVDTQAPSIAAPPNVSVSTGAGATSCGAFVSDATLGTPSASDGCSTSVTVTRTGVPSGNDFPVGTTVVTYTADDGHGHTAQAHQTVTVTDNTPPTISAPANITVNAPANSCAVNLDPGTATAGDNCPGVSVAGTRSDSQPLNAPYPVGTTTITWKATDAHGNTATATQTVTVKDVTPPTITLTTNVINLSPPNHQYQTLAMSDLVVSASDGCDASVDINDVVVSKVTSDELEDATGAGDGNTLNDAVIAPDCKSLQLRSERDGGGDGRVYTITLQVKDSSGNVATAVRKVFVPRTGPAVDSGVHYAVNGCAP
ncbi:MAG: Ig-like domain-containing protein [Acidobacteria bacterium]|nr:Ig-like domain-containing protein [Acidobacteriota bacterium]